MLRRRTIRRGEDRLHVVLERAPGVGQFQAADGTVSPRSSWGACYETMWFLKDAVSAEGLI